MKRGAPGPDAHRASDEAKRTQILQGAIAAFPPRHRRRFGSAAYAWAPTAMANDAGHTAAFGLAEKRRAVLRGKTFCAGNGRRAAPTEEELRGLVRGFVKERVAGSARPGSSVPRQGRHRGAPSARPRRMTFLPAGQFPNAPSRSDDDLPTASTKRSTNPGLKPNPQTLFTRPQDIVHNRFFFLQPRSARPTRAADARARAAWQELSRNRTRAGALRRVSATGFSVKAEFSQTSTSGAVRETNSGREILPPRVFRSRAPAHGRGPIESSHGFPSGARWTLLVPAQAAPIRGYPGELVEMWHGAEPAARTRETFIFVEQLKRYRAGARRGSVKGIGQPPARENKQTGAQRRRVKEPSRQRSPPRPMRHRQVSRLPGASQLLAGPAVCGPEYAGLFGPGGVEPCRPDEIRPAYLRAARGWSPGEFRSGCGRPRWPGDVRPRPGRPEFFRRRQPAPGRRPATQTIAGNAVARPGRWRGPRPCAGQTAAHSAAWEKDRSPNVLTPYSIPRRHRDESMCCRPELAPRLVVPGTPRAPPGVGAPTTSSMGRPGTSCFGLDHLLVSCSDCCLIVSDRWTLVKTITSVSQVAHQRSTPGGLRPLGLPPHCAGRAAQWPRFCV